MRLDAGGGRMHVAITFRDQPKHERRGNEHYDASLSRREAESLPHFIEFETAALFNHEYFVKVFCVCSCDFAAAHGDDLRNAYRGEPQI
jgi:hypothetical protein